MNKYNKRSRNFNLVLYPDEDISHNKALEFITTNYDFAYITHDKDFDDNGVIKKSHIHVVIRFSNARTIQSIANELNIEPNYIETTSSIDSSLLYLIHFYDKDKYQYSIDDVKGLLKNKLVKLINKGSKCEEEILQDITEYIINSSYIEYSNVVNFCKDKGYLSIMARRSYYFNNLIKDHNLHLPTKNKVSKNIDTLKSIGICEIIDETMSSEVIIDE